jgi:hypothetical protein
MARQLKPYVVDEVTSPNRLIRVPVYFDREKKDFFVEISGREDRVCADTVDAVKRLAKELLAKCVEYCWEPMIFIEPECSWEDRRSYGGRDGQHGASVEFKFSRFDRSPNPVKPEDWIYRDHILDFEASKPSDLRRRDREANKDLENVWPGEDDVVIPYDERTWEGLFALKKSVDEAHSQLLALMKRKDLADRLRLVGASLSVPILPAAVGKAKRMRR